MGLVLRLCILVVVVDLVHGAYESSKGIPVPRRNLRPSTLHRGYMCSMIRYEHSHDTYTDGSLRPLRVDVLRLALASDDDALLLT